MLTFHLEKSHHPLRVCGVDEAGRGPWAGPVVAAAAMFHAYRKPTTLARLNDSKKLSHAVREELFDIITQHATVGVGIASVEEIETLNIWGATTLAMRRAVNALPTLPDMALVDGKTRPREFPCATHMVIGGDGVSPSIAAASIIAKVTRDRIMRELAETYPNYGFDRHAGYGTQQHQDALALHGICPAHRRSYAPIRAIIDSVNAA